MNVQAPSETNKGKLWHGVKREEISWYPMIDQQLCTGCGLCILTCGNSVFRWNDKENRPLVSAEQNCVLGCTTCGKVCPEKAISFPEDPKGFMRKLVIKYKIYPLVKQELEQRLEKFPDHVVESRKVD
ncbi:MAG: 4Fe-4S dicluster domain-containing protein [Thermoplasmata archaeon]